MDSLLEKVMHHHHHPHHVEEESLQQQQQQKQPMKHGDMVNVQSAPPISSVDDIKKAEDTEPASIYKTVVEGTGAGYGDVEAYVGSELGLKETHDDEMRHQHIEDNQKITKPPVLTTNSSHPPHEHHPGPIEKLKHKVQATLQKVKSRKKKGSRGGEGTEQHSGSSSSSEDESGEYHK